MKMPLNQLKNRTELGQWLNANYLTGPMAEIGVAFGGYSREVLQEWKGREYVMVDPWAKQPKEVYKEKTDNIPYDTWHQMCVDLAKEDERVSIICDYSERVAPMFPNGYFDCVYIDGNHSYEAFAVDVELWWPKVRPGGLFCGHDCYNATTDGHYCEVLKVMEEWRERTGNKFLVMECSSWWVIKP